MLKRILLPLTLSLLVIPLVTLPSAAQSLKTSIKGGSWVDPTVWDDGVPSLEDSVIIEHAVTVSEETTIGSSLLSGSAPAVTVQGSGVLTIAEDAKLTVRGDLLLDNARLEMQAGSILEFDSSSSSLPADTSYSLLLGAGNTQPDAALIINGTPAKRAVIRSNISNGARPASITTRDFGVAGKLIAQYADFVNLGTATIPAVTFAPNGSSSLILLGSRFIFSGGLETSSNLSSEATVQILDNNWRGTLGDYTLKLYSYYELTSGTRQVMGNVFDKTVYLYPPRDISIADNYFHDGFDVTEGAWSLFDGNFVRHNGWGLRVTADVSNNYWLVDNLSGENPHFIQTAYYGRDSVVDGDIFEFTGSDENGDAILIGNPGVPTTTTIKNCIVLPNGIGETSGTLFSALGDSGTSLIVEHNTYITGSQGAAVSETYPGHAGMLASFRSNLAWDSSPRGFKLYDSGFDDLVDDLVSSNYADYNGGYNFLNGSSGKGYHNLESSIGNPGEHDLFADPEFL